MRKDKVGEVLLSELNTLIKCFYQSWQKAVIHCYFFFMDIYKALSKYRQKCKKLTFKCIGWCQDAENFWIQRGSEWEWSKYFSRSGLKNYRQGQNGKIPVCWTPGFLTTDLSDKTQATMPHGVKTLVVVLAGVLVAVARAQDYYDDYLEPQVAPGLCHWYSWKYIFAQVEGSDVDKRAWNSGFNSGMGKRAWNSEPKRFKFIKIYIENSYWLLLYFNKYWKSIEIYQYQYIKILKALTN